MTNTKFKISLAFLLILSLAGCSTASVITDTQIIVDAITVAAPIIAAFSGPGAAIVLAYLTTVANGLNCVLTAAEAPGATTATISAAIATCLGSVLLPNLPGVPPEIVALVRGIANEIANLIAKYGNKLGATPQPMHHLSYGDHRAIHHMRSQLNASMRTLMAAHK